MQTPAPPARAQFRPLSSYGVPSGPLDLPQVPSGYLEPEQSLPPQYQEPLLDMGSSLGYGQGMEYQYFNAPQPSQPMAVLRQTRLQQLRAERMRRQQAGQRDVTRAALRKDAPPAPLAGQSGSSLRSPATPIVVPPDLGLPPAAPWVEPVLPPPLLPDTPAVEAPPAPAPSRPRPPSGLLLSLPSKPLPAVHAPGSGGLLQKEDSGSIQRMNMARATVILTGSFIAGRILGLVRTSLFAFVFGTSMTSDAYLQAFLVPDLIFNVVAGGALSSAFIPIFTQYMIGERDERTAWRMASSALNLALAIMCVLAALAMFLAPWLVPLYNPGVKPEEMQLIISLTRIMLLQSVIMGGGVIINSVLYARQNFLLPAIGTVLYNVGLIIGLLPGFFLTFVGRSEADTTFAVYAATVGVVLGALLQVSVQIPGIVKERMRYTFSFDWKHPGVRQIGRQMLPRVLNAAMLYFSTFVDRGLILLLAAGPFVLNPQGLITQYYQALQLMLLPLGIFGMAISTAAFPTMAENVTLGRLDRVRAIIEDTLRTILFMSIPSSVGLIVLGLPVIQVLLQHGAFNLDSATSTSVPLAFFALGLAGLASVEILTRSFYAFRDSKTPVMVSVAQFVLKILLSLILLNLLKWGPSWGLGSLAFATSVAGSLEAAVLLWLLQKKIGMLGLRKLAMFTGRVLLASLAMGAGVLLLRTLLDLLLITTTSQSLGVLGTMFAIFKLAAELLAGLLVYIWATRQFGIEDFWKQGPVRRVLERFKLSWI
jgi:putative peptidoglycan lipid II flippase